MKEITGMTEKTTRRISELTAPELVGTAVEAEGAVHRVRNLGEVVFVVLRQAEGLLQAVFDRETFEKAGEIREGAALQVTGTLREEPRAPHGIEIAVKEAVLLSSPASPLPPPPGPLVL